MVGRVVSPPIILIKSSVNLLKCGDCYIIMKVYLLRMRGSEYENMFHMENSSDCPLVFSSKEKAQKWIEENWSHNVKNLPSYEDYWAMDIIETDVL